MESIEIYELLLKSQIEENLFFQKDNITLIEESDVSGYLLNTNNVSNKEESEKSMSFKNSPISVYKDSESENEKKMRNRESAKRYRERHKKQFSLIQKENEILKKELKYIIDYLNTQLCCNCKKKLLNRRKKENFFIVKKISN